MTGKSKDQIFLSYSRNDCDAAIALRTELEKIGFSVFRDEDSIRVGDNGLNRLQETLQQCSAFVLMLGRDGVQRWVGAEVQVALNRHISPYEDSDRLPIFPILLPEGDEAQLPPFLSLIQHHRWQPDKSLPESVIEAIRDKVELLNTLETFERNLRRLPFSGVKRISAI